VAWQIILYYALPEIERRGLSIEDVWAGQIIFPPDKPAIVRFNEEVETLVCVEGKWTAFDESLLQEAEKFEDVRPLNEPPGWAHVTFFIKRDEEKGERQIIIPNPNVAPIVSAVLHPPRLSQTLRLKTCVECGRLFVAEPKHPHQRYCSIRCRERAKKRRYRQRHR